MWTMDMESAQIEWWNTFWAHKGHVRIGLKVENIPSCVICFPRQVIEVLDAIYDLTTCENHPHDSAKYAKTKGRSYSLCVKSQGHHATLRHEQRLLSLHEARDTWKQEAVLISLSTRSKGKEIIKSICLEAYGWQGRITLEVFFATNNEILHQIR